MIVGPHERRAMKLASYWFDTAAPFQGDAAGPVEGRADVAVIGGGFTGLSAALALAGEGARVVLLEAGPGGGETRGRNGGHSKNRLSAGFAAPPRRPGSPLGQSLPPPLQPGPANPPPGVYE